MTFEEFAGHRTHPLFLDDHLAVGPFVRDPLQSVEVGVGPVQVSVSDVGEQGLRLYHLFGRLDRHTVTTIKVGPLNLRGVAEHREEQVPRRGER